MKNKKTTLRKIILTGAMLIALISNATNGLNNDPKKDLNKTTFTLKNVKQGNQLIIKDLYGLILYKEQIKDSGNYSKGFDLTLGSKAFIPGFEDQIIGKKIGETFDAAGGRSNTRQGAAASAGLAGLCCGRAGIEGGRAAG